jgi:hypothetical protein
MPEEQYQDSGAQYHVLPADDPLCALNILREAAGLDDWRTMDSGLSGLGEVTNSPRHHRYQQYRLP